MILRYSSIDSHAVIGTRITPTADIPAMTGGSASLLTKTHRNRIQDDFDELTDDKKHRDQQRIRTRVRAGLCDFHLLADYPDQQFELMSDNMSDDELQAALADTTLVVERLCKLNGIDRTELIDDARTRAETLSSETGTESLTQIDLYTANEVRQQTEAEITERLESGRWDKRQNKLAKLGASAFVVIALIGVFSWAVGDVTLSEFRPVLQPFFFLLYACGLGWLVIQATQVLKHDVFPFISLLVNDPREAAQNMIMKLIRNPGKTIRESWDDL
jgi:hypothetical protein